MLIKSLTRFFPRLVALLIVAAMLIASFGTLFRAARASSLLSQGKPATASSIEGPGFEASKAVDGDTTSTRWASVEPATTAQWIYVDLGATATISQVKLYWEAAYAKSFKIQVSNNASTWTTIYSTRGGDGGVDDLAVSGSGRYVRVYCTKRGTSYGYSLWEFQVYGTFGSSPTNTPPPTATPTRTPTPTTSPTGGVFFDDFTYSSSSDPALTGFGWNVRSGTGGPGVAGCSWSVNNVTFVDDGTNKLMRLTATTRGQGSNTVHAEIMAPKKFFLGTFAARVRFTDTPTTGQDGDQINETFFTIADWADAGNDVYTEMDHEYLANGGWGISGPVMWNTSWETAYDNTSTSTSGSLNGWHTLLIVAMDGQIKYYVDNALFATHGGRFYPDGLAHIAFNLWFIDDAGDGYVDGSVGVTTTTRTYVEDVDWVYYAKDTALTRAQVESNVATLRSQGYARLDTVQ